MMYLGVDVGKATLVAGRWRDGKGQALGEFPNTSAGLAALADRVAQCDPDGGVHLTLEPTGGYEAPLKQYAHDAGWQVHEVNPQQVRKWAAGVGYRTKTDSQDALMLARFGAERQPPSQDAVPPEVEQLRSLHGRRDDLEKMLRQERNRRGVLPFQPQLPTAVPESVDRMIDVIESELAQIDQAIRELLDQHPHLKQTRSRLLSVPGVGTKTVIPLLLCLNRWSARTGGAGTSKGITAFVGLDPKLFESGSSVHHRPMISHMGDRRMRQQLYMAALGGVRGNNALRDFYQGLVERGKPKPLALTAAAHKIIIWSWAVFQSDRPFDPERAVPHSLRP